VSRPITLAVIALLTLLPLGAVAQDEFAQMPPEGRQPGRGPGDGPPPPQDASFFQGQAMRAMDEKASLLLEQGKTEQAIQTLAEAGSLDVSKGSPFYEFKVRLLGRLARTYLDTGKKSEALQTIKTLLAEVPAGTPAEAAAWLEAGGVYKKAGMPEEALKAFDRSIELSKKLAQTGWTPPSPQGSPRGPRSGPGGSPPGSAQHP